MKFLNKIDGADKVVTDSSNRFVTDTEKDTWNGKVDASQVLTDVPANAVFTDTNTVTSINGKTGAIAKADIVALGIPAQDTVYTHPTTHPASMIVESTIKRFVSDAEKAEWNSKSIKNIGAFNSHEELIMYAITEQIPTGQYAFFMGRLGHASLALIREAETYYEGIAQGSDGLFVVFDVTKQGQMREYGEFDARDVIASLDDITSIFSQLDDKVDNSRVLTDVPLDAKFTDTVYTHPTTAGNKHIPTGGASGQVLKYSASGTATWQADNDTITTINGKTGAIAKADITALGIPAQDTVVDISGKADKTYVDNKVKTDVPAGAKFTDTVYTHPTTAGNKHIPTAGATSNFLVYGGASGTASWSAMSDTLHGTRGGGTQHSVATTSANGFMSGTDKTKLDGIDSGANKITLGTTQPTVGWWFKEIT